MTVKMRCKLNIGKNSGAIGVGCDKCVIVII